MPMSSIARQNNVVGKYYNHLHDNNRKATTANRKERSLHIHPARDAGRAGHRILALINATNVMETRRPVPRQSNIINLLTLLSLIKPGYGIGSLNAAPENVGHVATALAGKLPPAAQAPMPIGFRLPLQSTADVSVRTSLPRGNVRAKRSAEADLHERMDDMLILQTAENAYPTTVDALMELYQSIAVIKNEKMANEVYGLLFVVRKICHQAEYFLAAGMLEKADLIKHESYIKQNNFSARHLRKLKRVSEELRNDVVNEALNAYQSFRICTIIAKSEKKIEAIIKKISKTYDQKQGVAAAVVEEELRKNSHVLGMTEQKLNKISDDIQDAIREYTQATKAPYCQEIISQGHPGIVVLALAHKNVPLSSVPEGSDGKHSTLSLIDKADQDFVAKVVVPHEEKAKSAVEKRGGAPSMQLAAGGRRQRGGRGSFRGWHVLFPEQKETTG